MYWLLFWIVLLIFFPLFRLGIVFLGIFIVINILLVFLEIFFRLSFQKKQSNPFRYPKKRPAAPSSFGKEDEVEDAEFREEK